MIVRVLFIWLGDAPTDMHILISTHLDHGSMNANSTLYKYTECETEREIFRREIAYISKIMWLSMCVCVVYILSSCACLCVCVNVVLI